MISQFNAYSASGAKPFLFNQTYDMAQANEANLYDQIYSEFTWLNGSDIIWMPREMGPAETVFGEYLATVINKGFPIRLFIEEVEAWGGNGDMFSKFGLQVQDEVTLFCNKTTFANAAGASGATGIPLYPKQGDVVYINKSKKLFEVSHIEDQSQPGFFLFGNKTGYKIQCKSFSYDHEFISQSPTAGIPSAVQALDTLLAATNTSEINDVVSDDRQTNAPLRKKSVTVIDTTERDPLLE